MSDEKHSRETHLNRETVVDVPLNTMLAQEAVRLLRSGAAERVEDKTRWKLGMGAAWGCHALRAVHHQSC